MGEFCFIRVHVIIWGTGRLQFHLSRAYPAWPKMPGSSPPVILHRTSRSVIGWMQWSLHRLQVLSEALHMVQMQSATFATPASL